MKGSSQSFWFFLPQGRNIRELAAILKERFPLDGPISSAPVTFQLFDTYDWRLFQQKLLFWQEQDTITLRKRRTLKIVQTHPEQNIAGFWWEFPNGQFRATLSDLISVRRLLPQAAGERQLYEFKILNSDEKIVCRVYWWHVRSATTSQVAVRIQPLKGYENDAATFVRFFREHWAAEPIRDIGKWLFRALGKEPRPLSTKMILKIDPESSVAYSLARIFHHLSSVMESNVSGILEEIDSECLHDFRVAVRRTRAALGQLKDVLPENFVSTHRSFFQDLGKRSNQARDLDVYLLHEGSYRSQVPEELQFGLDALFSYLHEQRALAYRSLKRFLKSKSYRKQFDEWKQAVARLEQTEALLSIGKPISRVASQKIWKQFRKVRKVYQNSAGRNGEDADSLHRLRIECKKLRYLMEFFASLYPKREVGTFLGGLKSVQDLLGRYNDLNIQQQFLLHLLTTPPTGAFEKRETVAAIGCLVGTLRREQAQLWPEIDNTVADFLGSDNRKRARQLFAQVESS